MNKTNAFSNLAYKSVLIIGHTANANESKITLVRAAILVQILIALNLGVPEPTGSGV